MEKYKKYLDELEQHWNNKYINEDQKEMMKSLFEKIKDDDHILQETKKLLLQRVKLGFRFDIAPEPDKTQISLLIKDKQMSIQNDILEQDNQLIIGENYDALKNLIVIERERDQANKYNIIYIDPPYNTEATKTDGNTIANDKEDIKNDTFQYRDRFSRNGWLNFMNEILTLARKLLSDDGIIFVSIDDNEQAYLKVLMDEIFGEENFISTIKWRKTNSPSGNTNQNKKFVNIQHEYIHLYAKDKGEINSLNYYKYDEEDFEKNQYKFRDKDEQLFQQRGYYKLTPLIRNNSGSSFKYTPSLDYEIEAPDGTFFKIGQNMNVKNAVDKSCYTWSYDTFLEGKKQGFIVIKKNNKNGFWEAHRKVYSNVIFNPKTRKVETQEKGLEYNDYFDLSNKSNKKDTFNEKIDYYHESTTQSSANDLKQIGIFFKFSKPYKLIKHLINFYPNKDAKILDFFAGSGTTGHAVLDLNREDGGKRTFTLVTNNENNIASEITYERLYRIIKGRSTKGESNFKWLEKNKPFINTNLNVFKIKYFNISIDSHNESDITKLFEIFKESLVDFNVKKYSLDEKEILYNLTELKALRK